MPRPRDHTGARIGAQITQLLTAGNTGTKTNAIMKNKLYAAQLREINNGTLGYFQTLETMNYSTATDEQLNRLAGWLDFISGQCKTIIELNEYAKKSILMAANRLDNPPVNEHRRTYQVAVS